MGTWIKTSERMPGENGRYLLTVEIAKRFDRDTLYDDPIVMSATGTMVKRVSGEPIMRFDLDSNHVLFMVSAWKPLEEPCA